MKRLMELTKAYDQLSFTAELPDLTKESIYDVADLLCWWIFRLPLPVMHRTFVDGFTTWCVDPCSTREKERKRKIHTRQKKNAEGEVYSETDTEAEKQSEEDENCPGLPSFNSRRRRARLAKRAEEREKRRAFAELYPELVVSTRPSHAERRTQMYRELRHLESAQIHHAQLTLMLLSPHAFSLLVYLLTFLSSLTDHPDNGLTAYYLADKFAWKLLGGPNKAVSRELLDWLLTRWDTIIYPFKSDECHAWDKKNEEQSKGEAARNRSGSTSSATSNISNPAPQYTKERRGSGETDRSEVPSYHSTWSGHHDDDDDDDDDRKPSSSSSPPCRFRRSSSPRSRRSSRRSSGSRPTTAPAVAPRLHDFHEGAPLCAPCPTAVTVELTNPWDAEDTAVISPIKDVDVEYEAEDEDFDDGDDDDSWDPPQRTEFHAIESMLQPNTGSGEKELALSVRTTSEMPSIYSQGQSF